MTVSCGRLGNQVLTMTVLPKESNLNTQFIKVILIVVNHFVFTVAEIQSNQTVDCIVQAVHLIAKRKIAVEFTEDSQDLASGILQKVNIPVVLNAKEHRKQRGIEYRRSIDVLILLKDTKPADILNNTLWNGDTRFVIIANDEDTLEDYFEHFWELRVINVFGMVMNEYNSTVYSFLPYGKKNCTKAEIITVDSCVDGLLQNEGTALTETFRIKNMNGCPMNVTVTDARPTLIFEPEKGRNDSSTAKGFEGKFMLEFAKLSNVNLSFRTAQDGLGWGWVYPSPHGVIGDVYRGVGDVGLGLLGPILQRYEYLDWGANYNMYECVTFAVPRGYGAKQAYWLTIFVLEFTYHTWILILFSFALIAVNIWLINKYLTLNWLVTKSEIAIFLFSSFLGLPIKTPHLASARTSVLFWTTCTFILMVSYKASMGSKLAVPPHDPDINTFEELLQSDLELMGVKNMVQLFEPKNEWPFNEIVKRYRFTNGSIDSFVKRIADREKVSYIRHRSSLFYHSLMIPNARGRVHAIKDCVYPYVPYPMLKKFSPFTKRLSQVVRRLEESGIMEMWRAEYIKDIPAPKKPFFKLSMRQMFGVFCFLSVGYVVSIIAFLYEIYVIFGVRKGLSVLLANVKIQ